MYWSGAFLDTEQGRRTLDVTDLGIHSAPLSTLRLGGRLTEMRREGRELFLAGDVINPLGRIEAGLELTAKLEIRDRRRKRRAFHVPVTLRRDGARIGWQAKFVPVRKIRPIGLVDQTWGLWLRLKAGDDTVMVRLTSEGAAHDGIEVPVRPRATRVVGDTLEAYVAESGELALRIIGRRWPARITLPLLRRVARTGLGMEWWRRFLRAEKALVRLLTGRATKDAVFNRVLVRLPVKKGTIVFESHLGAQYSDNPQVHPPRTPRVRHIAPGDLVLQQEPARISLGRETGQAEVLGVLPGAGPCRVLGRQPGLPGQADQAPADDLHPDLARLGVQADGLRRTHGQAEHLEGTPTPAPDDRPVRPLPRPVRARRPHAGHGSGGDGRAAARRVPAQRSAGHRRGRGGAGRAAAAAAAGGRRPHRGAVRPDVPYRRRRPPGGTVRDPVRPRTLRA